MNVTGIENVQELNTDFEVRSLDTFSVKEPELKHSWWYNFKYTLAGLR